MNQADLLTLSPEAFEKYICDLYQAMGYQTQRRGTLTTSDQGVDIEARKWRQYLVIQCKRYQGSVPFEKVRDLAGVVVKEKATKGILITTGTFTEQSKEWAKGLPLELIDGEALATLHQKQTHKWKWRVSLPMPNLKNVFSWFKGVPSEISVTESPPQRIEERNPQTGKVQKDIETKRLSLSRQTPRLSGSITVNNDHLTKKSSVSMTVNGSAHSISQAEAAIKFYQTAIKLGEKLARYPISNR